MNNPGYFTAGHDPAAMPAAWPPVSLCLDAQHKSTKIFATAKGANPAAFSSTSALGERQK